MIKRRETELYFIVYINIKAHNEAQDRVKYKIPLVPPITLLTDDPISFTVSAASFRG